jgi:type II secretory pathway pseudopilin PulG
MLVEVLLSLAILAALMAALGVAVHASLASYRENDKITSSTQAARAVLERLSRDIRTAAAVDAQTDTVTIIPPDTGSGIQQVQYEYDSANGQILYRVTANGQTTSHVLLGGNVEVTAFSVTTLMGQDWQGLTCIGRLTIRIGLSVDNQTIDVTSSVAPRRNQLY